MSLENREELKNTSAYDIILKFFDEGSFVETDALVKSKDGFAEAVTGFGTVDGVSVYAFAQNVDICGGAMSKAQARKILKIYDMALKTGAPVVGFYDSVGGRLDQGAELLASYGEILKSASNLSGVVPQISVVLGTCLGTSALTASSADFIVMSKDASLSINTSGNDSDSEFNKEHGIANFVCDDKDAAIEKAKQLITYFPSNNLEEAPLFSDASYTGENSEYMVSFLADDDSLCCVNKDFGTNVDTAFGRIAGQTVGFVSAKGKKIDCKSGQKISKFVRFCDAFSIPVITIADAEEFSSLKAAAKVASAYAEATTAKISVINGTAVGAVYIALAGTGSNADMVYALDGSIISPVAKKAAAFIMDPENMNIPVDKQDEAAEKFAKEHLSANNAAMQGYVDDVVDKSELRAKIISSLDMLVNKRVSTLPKKHSTI